MQTGIHYPAIYIKFDKKNSFNFAKIANILKVNVLDIRKGVFFSALF